jgi:putative hydrolase of the HAD superfamily
MSFATEAARPDLDHISVWVFDLDNTLYPSHCNLFHEIDKRMGTFISRLLDVDAYEARRIQKTYLHRHGTTLNGLMKEHDVDPVGFMSYVHDINVDRVPPNPRLGELISALPGKKYIYTNGSIAHADNVTTRLGVKSSFDGVFDIAAADYIPKPHRESYERFLEAFEVAAACAMMFEDIAGNLVCAEEFGMTTALVHSHKDWMDEPGADQSIFHSEDHNHVHHVIDDLTAFLERVVNPQQSCDRS